jgi:hypothetical protein
MRLIDRRNWNASPWWRIPYVLFALFYFIFWFFLVLCKFIYALPTHSLTLTAHHLTESRCPLLPTADTYIRYIGQNRGSFGFNIGQFRNYRLREIRYVGF